VDKHLATQMFKIGVKMAEQNYWLNPDTNIHEEAIKWLKENCDKSHPAVILAIISLDKQIPKKAVGNHYAHMRCPACNHRIPSGGGSSSRRRDNWCNYCGQKIDWDRKELN